MASLTTPEQDATAVAGTADRVAGACRLAIVASHPIQYFTPVYRRLAARADLEVEVLYCRDYGVRPRFDKEFGRPIQWDLDQLGGYDSRFLRNISPVHDTFNPLHAMNPGVLPAIARGRFDAVWVNGYLYPSNWLALLGARLGGAKILMRSELWLDPGRQARRFDGLRDRLIRWWVRRSDALLYIGEQNRRAYEHYGARAEQLVFSPYSVDVERVAQRATTSEAERSRLRERLELPREGTVVLYVGKLTERKHPEVMLTIAREVPDATIVIVGSGPLEGVLRARIADEELTNVRLCGFVNQSGLPDYYAAADVFVMPSEREPWGLVLNEAMAAGLPAVVTDQVGAAADLVQPGETGFIVRPGEWEAMTAHVRTLVARPELRATLSRRARERAMQYGYDQTADGVVAALSRLGLLPRADHSPSREVP